MFTDLEKAIIATLVYFDIFDFPLTAFEIWQWLWLEPKRTDSHSYYSVRKNLRENHNLIRLIDSQDGFYFLKNRERIVGLRLENYKVAERKFKKARRFIKILRLAPFIKMVAVCNSLAFSNAGDYSDIDFFIITQKKRIFLARLWANFLPKILGRRPTKSDTQDKLCFTFFISEDKLNIEDLQCNHPDIYLAHWVTQIFPIYDPYKLYQAFIKNNVWVAKYFPNFRHNDMNDRRKVGKNFFVRLSCFFIGLGYRSFWGDWQETIARKFQLFFLPYHLKKLANQDTRVVISDQVLKFHDNDRRTKFKEMYEEKMVKVTGNE